MEFKDYYTKDESELLIKEIFSEFEKMLKEGKNLFDWLLQQSRETLQKFNEKELPEKEKLLRVEEIVVLMAIKSYMLEKGKKSISEDKIHIWVNSFIVLASFASFVNMGLMEVNEESKWMNPKTKIGFKLTDLGTQFEEERRKFENDDFSPI